MGHSDTPSHPARQCQTSKIWPNQTTRTSSTMMNNASIILSTRLIEFFHDVGSLYLERSSFGDHNTAAMELWSLEELFEVQSLKALMLGRYRYYRNSMDHHTHAIVSMAMLNFQLSRSREKNRSDAISRSTEKRRTISFNHENLREI